MIMYLHSWLHEETGHCHVNIKKELSHVDVWPWDPGHSRVLWTFDLDILVTVESCGRLTLGSWSQLSHVDFWPWDPAHSWVMWTFDFGILVTAESGGHLTLGYWSQLGQVNVWPWDLGHSWVMWTFDLGILVTAESCEHLIWYCLLVLHGRVEPTGRYPEGPVSILQCKGKGSIWLLEK